VFAGAFLEEIVSPIPSFVVMIPAGAAAQIQGVGWWYLVPLAFIGAAGRLLASVILYFIADKAEDWLLSKGRRFFGVTHRQLEGYGQRLSGTPRDFTVLFLLNAVPVIPTSLLSLTCGFIKVRFRLFVGATFFGSAVNAAIYMGIGYAGLQAVTGLESVQAVLQAIGLLLLVSFAGWLIYYMQKKGGR
jgi:membrane protein DedA with SNARE-associated domain